MTRIRAGLAMVVLVIAVIAIAASGSSNKATKVGSKSSKTSTFKVGDDVKLGDWTVKVWAVSDPQAPANEFSKPAEGKRWVGVDTEVKNLSKSPETVSSLACLELQDSKNQTYSEEITSGVTPGPPDGEVDPSGAKRGLVVFEVPQDATGLKLRFKCDLLSSGSAVIALS